MADKTVTVGPGKTYASLQAAITGEVTANANLVTMGGILNIVLYAFADTTQATIAGFTTDATRYVNIYTASGERHSGYWDGNKYNLIVNTGTPLIISNSYTRVNVLQVSVGMASDYGATRHGILVTGASVTGCRISQNIVRSTIASNFHNNAYGINCDYTGAGGNFIYNNIVYGFLNANASGGGIGTGASSASYAYSNTIVGCLNGIQADNYRELVAKNNLISGCTTAFNKGANSTWTGSGYNSTNAASFGANYTAQTGDRVSQAFTFTDAANKNYLITSADAGALVYGADLSADSYLPFGTDIIGVSRATPWSIGANQPASGGATPAPGCPFLLMFCRQ
jgi:hypothetical protein